MPLDLLFGFANKNIKGVPLNIFAYFTEMDFIYKQMSFDLLKERDCEH